MKLSRLLFSLFCFFVVQVFAFEQGLVQQGSSEEKVISGVLRKTLSTQTGCEISTRIFLSKPDYLARFLGMTLADAKEVSRTCPTPALNAASFFKAISETRPAKTYSIFQTTADQSLNSWTHSSNKTDLYLNHLSDERLIRILVHEMIITMDDKYNLTVNGFSKLQFSLKSPSENICVINRFLSNPYYQVLLASLRAFWMEMRFAADLNDENWFSELESYGLLSKNALDVFEGVQNQTQKLIVQTFQAKKTYTDLCTGKVLNTEFMNETAAQILTARDFAELKMALLDSENLNILMEFLTRQVSISALDSNLANSGPRPGINPGGWSKAAGLEDSLRQKSSTKGLKSKRLELIPKLQTFSTEEWKNEQLKIIEGDTKNQSQGFFENQDLR